MVYHRSSQLNIFYILIEKTLYSPYLGYTPAIKDSNRISTIYICTICSGNSMITGFSIFKKKKRGVPELQMKHSPHRTVDPVISEPGSSCATALVATRPGHITACCSAKPWVNARHPRKVGNLDIERCTNFEMRFF